MASSADRMAKQHSDEKLQAALDVSIELEDLQTYLHRQFDQQGKLLEDLRNDMKILVAGLSNTNFQRNHSWVSHTAELAPLTPPPAPQPVVSVLSHRSSDTSESENDEVKRSTVMSHRQTFVRSDMLERQLKARKQQEIDDEERDLPEILHGDLSREPSLKLRMRKWVLSPLFSNVIMVFIVANAIMLGVEIDVSASYGQSEVPQVFGIVNLIFVAVFVIETVLKFVVLGCHEYWRGPDRKWNIFDFVIVAFSVAETVLDIYSQVALDTSDGSNSIRVMRALRLARTLRGVRLFRVLRYFAALRGLLLSIASTLGSLLWTLVLLQLLFYVFAVIFAQLVTDYCRFQTIEATGDPNSIPQCPEDLHYWQNVMDSMHTLFMAITGGLNWFDCYLPLKKVSLAALWLLNLFIVIGFFTILNVVTGVFVNTAIEGAAADKDMATLKQAQFRMSQIASLREVFKEITTNDRESLKLSDLEDALNEDKLGHFMASLGISTDDVWTLFLLIDVDANGQVDIEEFVSGCLQLRGPAQSLQVAKMSYENKLTRQKISKMMRDMEEVKDSLGKMFRPRARPVVSQPL